MTYAVIYADPPWEWCARSPKGEGRSAKNHYDVMSLADIKALPVGDIAAKDSVLLLWVINSLLPESFDVIRVWGFAYSTTGFIWIKSNRTKPGFAFGGGYHTRKNAELCLLAKRGKGLKRLNADVAELIVAPRGKHSAKPPETRDRIVRLYGDVPRVELFARDRAPGWDAWGNEVDPADRISWEALQANPNSAKATQEARNG